MNEATSHPILLLLALLVLGGCDPQVNVADLQMNISNKIDQITADYPDATLAVSVRDPQTGLRLDRNADRLFHAASTMKVPVMIEVFRQAEEGRFSLTDSILVENRFRSIVDGSEYAIGDDSDDTIYTWLETQRPIHLLVEQMITVSSNLATNLLIGFVGAETVQATSERLGTTDMETLRGVEDLKAFRLGMSNRTTSRDLAVLLEALMEGDAVSEASDGRMVDIMSRQQMNEMIPAGLPEGTVVAHKTGQITEIHHDAAVVFPTPSSPYILVILIEGIADDTMSARLGSAIATAVHAAIRPSS